MTDEARSAAPGDTPFADVLRYLREMGEPCRPPVGVGTFELLCASERHILVWYTPAREGQRGGERAIPTRPLAAAWEALRAGGSLDEAALVTLGASPAVGRWLLALLAQLPGVCVCDDGQLTLEPPRDSALTAPARRCYTHIRLNESE